MSSALRSTLVERAVDVAALDSFRLQLSPEKATRQVAALLARGDPVHCKRGVVHQSDFLESIEHSIDHTFGHILGLQCLVKLVSGASFGGQLAQRDGTGHRLDVGINIIGSAAAWSIRTG